MNAKELAEKVRRVKAPDFPIVMRSTLNELAECIATDIEQLIPRYRPPQPSDDGRWCYVEQLPDFKGPQQIFASASGEYWFDDVAAVEIKIVTKGVWPCERPE